MARSALSRRAELAFAALIALLGGAAHGGTTTYCCEDANGRRICADVLPTVCYGRAYREIGPQGAVRQIAAPPTSQEIAQRQAEAQRRKDEEARLLKQRRLDQALLQTYTSLEDIDRRLERAVADGERSLAQVRAREAELLDERKRLAEGPGTGPGRDKPRNAAAAVQAVDSELASLRGVVDAKNRELEAVRARYAADRQRYAELIAAGETRR